VQRTTISHECIAKLGRTNAAAAARKDYCGRDGCGGIIDAKLCIFGIESVETRALKLDAILETALYVDDLDRARLFFQETLGLSELYRDKRMCALSVAARNVLLLFVKGASNQTAILPGGEIPPHDGDGRIHVAFAIPADDLEAWERRLAGRGVAIEGRTRWPRGGTSIYFRDPDDHLLELATPGLWTTY
jgi:catechol 2,3-dioxygenase-like lactoylglutathione lyase family enzyme